LPDGNFGGLGLQPRFFGDHSDYILIENSARFTSDGYRYTRSPSRPSNYRRFTPFAQTMYDGKTQLFVANPINRYLINSL
jgi:hypothetical protein